MKSFTLFFCIFCILLLMIALCPDSGLAQSDKDIGRSVEDLVGKHYMDGIPYPAAHALGPEALPYLFEILHDKEKKPFWVNIIVTIGFIEDPSAVGPLIAFLENTQGEVDQFTFRALLSVPYALGCIASVGDPRAFQFLADSVQLPLNLRCTFRDKPINNLIVEESVMSLAVSGLPEARSLLLGLKPFKEEKAAGKAAPPVGENVTDALIMMDRMASEGRAAVLNPQRED